VGRAATAIELDADVRGMLKHRAGSLTMPAAKVQLVTVYTRRKS
jgi:hypothetical protein